MSANSMGSKSYQWAQWKCSSPQQQQLPKNHCVCIEETVPSVCFSTLYLVFYLIAHHQIVKAYVTTTGIGSQLPIKTICCCPKSKLHLEMMKLYYTWWKNCIPKSTLQPLWVIHCPINSLILGILILFLKWKWVNLKNIKWKWVMECGSELGNLGLNDNV